MPTRSLHRLLAPTARAIALVLLVALGAPSALGQAAGPLDIAGDLAAGRATVTASDWDIGNPQAMFDGSAGTLYRSAGVNPAVVTIGFTTPREVRAVGLHLAGGDSEITLEAADTLADLEAQAGSYRQVLAATRVTNEVPTELTTITTERRIWRATVERVVGDDFVHIRELVLVGSPNLTAVAIEPGTLVLDPGEQRRVELIGTGSAGERVIFDRGVSWAIPDGAAVATIDPTGLVTGVGAGSKSIVGTAAGRRAFASVTVNSADVTDLDATFIRRFPEYSYSAAKNRPDPGDTVTYRAHVRQRGGRVLDGVGYRWLVDGAVVETGVLDSIAPNGEATVDLERTWSDQRSVIRFEIDTAGSVDEVEEQNNAVSVYSDAILVGFWVERTLYDYFADFQQNLGVGSNSFENWAQRQIAWQNQLHAEAVWPTSPDGVLDRYSIQKIVIVEDGQLPLSGGLATNNPDLNDRTVDLMWGFPSVLVTQANNFYANTSLVSDTNPFYREPSLLHELGHARYLVDHYAYDVNNTAPIGGYDQVQVTENGQPIAGTSLLPFVAFGEVLYYNQTGGIMSGPFGFRWSPHEAAALNLIAGDRARCGNYNAPCNIGEYINDLPASNILRFVDAQGRPLIGADIRIFRAKDAPGLYGKKFVNPPDDILFTGCGGAIEFGRNPWNPGGNIVHNTGFINGLMLIRIQTDTGLWYRFWEVGHANLAYWSGSTQEARYDLVVNGAVGQLSADLDPNGELDLFDILEFFGLFAAQDDGADFETDGTFDLFDILRFFEVFAAGC